MTAEQAPGIASDRPPSPPSPPRRRCGHPACDREPYPAGKDWAAFCREHSVPETLDAIREAGAANGPELMPDEWPRADPKELDVERLARALRVALDIYGWDLDGMAVTIADEYARLSREEDG